MGAQHIHINGVKKGQAFTFYVSLIDQLDTKLIKTSPTLAAADFNYSGDGGALTALTNTPTEAPAGSGAVGISLTASEMNYTNIVVVCSDAAGSEWCDLTINIHTQAEDFDSLGTKVDTIDTNVDAVLVDTGTTLPSTLSTIEGKIDTVDTNVDAVLVDTGTTLPATLSTIEGKIDTVDTNVDAILVDTGTTIPGTLSTMQTDVTNILTDTGTTLDGKIDSIQTDVTAILTDTGTTLDGKINTINTNVSAILTDTGTSIPSTLSTIESKIDTVDTNVDAILVDTGTTIPGTITTLQTDVTSILNDTGTDGVKIDFTQSVPQSPTSGTFGQYIYETKARLANKTSLDTSTGVLTVFKDDNTTSLFQLTFNSVSAPTIITRT